MGAVAQKHKMFLCVQDLTCPGAALIESAGLAAHVPGVTAIEANAREYVPAANKPWENRYPGISLCTTALCEPRNWPVRDYRLHNERKNRVFPPAIR